MKVSRLLTEVLLKKFCESLEGELNESEAPSPELNNLLKQAQTLVFNKYKIDPKSKTYFIAGSARLHLYPKLREVMKMERIGDLDIVIPELPEITKKLATSSTNTDTKTDDSSNTNTKNNDSSKPIEPVEPGTKIVISKEIEIFDKWDPAQAKPEGAKDFTVESTKSILDRAKSVQGYWYMSLFDVMDYKLNLNRDKEKNLTIYLSKYLNATTKEEKIEIQNKILEAFAGNEEQATDFLQPAINRVGTGDNVEGDKTKEKVKGQTPPPTQKQVKK